MGQGNLPQNCTLKKDTQCGILMKLKKMDCSALFPIRRTAKRKNEEVEVWQVI